MAPRLFYMLQAAAYREEEAALRAAFKAPRRRFLFLTL